MIESVLTLLTVCFMARMSPGPDMMLLIHHAGSRSAGGFPGLSGSRGAFGCVLGVCLGLTFHVSLSVLGLALLLKSNHVLFNVLRYAGALYLLYIGYRCFSDTGAVDLDSGRDGLPESTSFMQGFRDGLFCNLLNPKVTLFILSVFMQFVGPDAGLHEKIIYGTVIVLEALVGWGIFVIFLNTAFMQRIYSRYAVVLNRVTGVILFLLGGAIFVSG
ncbi:LysE family translocator [Maridesulfovibrio sp. FT414]|uniref:LysE family translocator n=1 Tax=Maridesulfovibrio sp. FT414 TaxID=2979469 RepID=UPI003D800265